MPVNTAHPDFADWLDIWQQMRDVIGGSRPVKAQAQKYLPRLSKMTDEDYEAYKMRADFFDGTSRASDAMMGFLFRKAPKVNIPEGDTQLEEFQKDATLTGKSLYDLAKDVSRKVVDVGRCGVWVDWSDDENRAFALVYEAHDIINWAYGRRGGRTVLTHLVLHEMSPEFVDLGGMEKPDKYKSAVFDQWREFELVQDGHGNNFVQITLWRKKKTAIQPPSTPTSLGGRIATMFGTGPASQTGDDQFVRIGNFQPKRGGYPIDQILFTFVGTSGPYPDICKPPLLGMADMNLSHYRTSADLENGRHLLGVPTPWFAGFTEGGKPMTITLGASRALVTSELGASCGYLQVQDSFGALSDGLKEKKQSMAELGVQMIASQEADHSPEAYATVALRQTSQSSGLTAIARALSQCLTDVITMVAWWSSRVSTPQELQDNINVQMNLDFMGDTVTGADAAAYAQLYFQGAISYETLFKLLQDGEIIEDGLTVEEELKRIRAGKAQAQSMLPQPSPQPKVKTQPSKTPPPSQSNV